MSAKKRRADAVAALLPFASQFPAAPVRCAALDALAQLCGDAAPELQQEHAGTLLPALCACVRTERAVGQGGAHRARSAACRALLLFLDAASPDVVRPHMDACAASFTPRRKPLSPFTKARGRHSLFLLLRRLLLLSQVYIHVAATRARSLSLSLVRTVVAHA